MKRIGIKADSWVCLTEVCWVVQISSLTKKSNSILLYFPILSLFMKSVFHNNLAKILNSQKICLFNIGKNTILCWLWKAVKFWRYTSGFKFYSYNLCYIFSCTHDVSKKWYGAFPYGISSTEWTMSQK